MMMFMVRSINIVHYPLRRIRLMVDMNHHHHHHHRGNVILSANNTFSSSSNNMFSYTSKRASRRRHKRRLQQRLQAKQHQQLPGQEKLFAKASRKDEYDDDDDYVDTRTVRDILYPRPLAITGDDSLQKKPIKLSKLLSFQIWKMAWQTAWPYYRSTWEGFWTSKGFIVDHHEDGEEKDNSADDTDKKKNKVDTDNSKDKENSKDHKGKKDDLSIQRNVRRNVQFLKASSASLKENVSQQTGIRTADDVKRVAEDGMRLFNETIHEFMAGYRKGRDDEVERILTEHYTTAADTSSNQQENKTKHDDTIQNKKRRRKKRRILMGTRGA